ncbi:MAG: competence/damage-inducible protein A [Myxococcaceae bacterium]|nr:competence/damage-inducible protein A [Myxococcaceae bacterium]
MSRYGAAAVIIGNEVLSAKVVEANGAHLIQRLKARGVPLRMVTFVPDEVDLIVDAVSRARSVAEWVLTSGGIGPTHDDVTVRAVSLALGRRVVRVPSLAEEVKRHYGERATDEALRLADAPEGAELITRDGAWYPVIACDGVFMLPGVPQLFKLQLETVLPRLRGTPVFLKTLYLRPGEPELARSLDAVALAMPEVAIGSYPQFEPGLDYKVKVTVEAADRAQVEAAVNALLEQWPSGAVVKTEDDAVC